MSSKSWFAKRSSRANESRRSRTGRKSRPVFDTLEDRAVPAIIISHVAAPTPSNNDFTVFKNALAGLTGGETVEINGTLDWSEPEAFTSWASTGFGFAMPHVNGVTLEPMTAGSGIKGPGTEGGEAGPIYFDGLGTDQSWNITGLTIKNFDVAIFYSQESNVTDFSGTHITDNAITVPNAGPSSQNGGIILGPSPNQVVQGNTISITGNGGASSSSFGIDAFTFPGAGAWNNLLIVNNIVSVTTVGATEKIIGFSENTGSTGSNITVTNNTFNGDSGALAGNQQVAFGITSESSSTATVVYTGNTVNGAKDGFVWGDPEQTPAYNFTSDTGIIFSGTTLKNVGTGFFDRDGGTASIGTTTITNTGNFNFGTAFKADGPGTVITVTDPVSNFFDPSGVANQVETLDTETNSGQVIFTQNAAGVGDVVQNEGNTGGVTVFSFPVILGAPLASGQTFSVEYTTADGPAGFGVNPKNPLDDVGSATAGQDYASASGVLLFSGGSTSQTISVRVGADLTPEPDEAFSIILSDPVLITNGSATPSTLSGPATAVGIIVNDDSTTLAVSLGSNPVSVTKPATGTTTMTFNATLNAPVPVAPAGQPTEFFTVNYHATDGSAHNQNDFTLPAGTLTFMAGSTTPINPITVTVGGGPANSSSPENFNVVLDAGTAALHFTGLGSLPASIGTSTETGDINNPAPSTATVSINSVEQKEANPGGTTTFTFTVTATNLTASTSVNFQTQAGTALPGQNFVSKGGSVPLTPNGMGTATATITVVVGNTRPGDLTDTFSVALSYPSASFDSIYTFGTQIGIGTIDK
jgi:Calx-beta domain